MVDVHSKKQRSYNMSQIRSKNTKPEILVRSLVHRMGFRYRVHQRDLPGKPDLVLKRHRKVIFVHGCFWHMHKCRYGRVKPETRARFWETKRAGNASRDKKNLRKLRKDGWKVLVVWECQTRNLGKLTERIRGFLEPD
jgi:DNA mismatch endonuclease (patch repair protein)